MRRLFLRNSRKEKRDVVFLHGWGSNTEIWRTIAKECSSYFNIYLIDLPGYGCSDFFQPMPLQHMAEIIWQQAPKEAIWLGWSLGGLIAKVISIAHQAEIAGLITVASTPCFSKKKNWPGLNPMLLTDIEQQLHINFYRTVKRFLILQTLGTKTAYKDIRLLQTVLFKQPLPSINILSSGLKILKTTDLRQSLLTLNKPFLRIYGGIDHLIPNKLVPIMDKWLPNSHSVVIENAAHVPFISHSKKFIQLLVDFSCNL